MPRLVSPLVQVNIENGRVIDRTETGVMLKSALRAIVDKYGLTMVCTPNQSVLFRDIAPEQREGVEAILDSYGVKPIEQVNRVFMKSEFTMSLDNYGISWVNHVLSKSQHVCCYVLTAWWG